MSFDPIEARYVFFKNYYEQYDNDDMNENVINTSTVFDGDQQGLLGFALGWLLDIISHTE